MFIEVVIGHRNDDSGRIPACNHLRCDEDITRRRRASPAVLSHVEPNVVGSPSAFQPRTHRILVANFASHDMRITDNHHRRRGN
jgi:hypothetical protein